MSEEVKVNIRSEADNRGLDDTQAKIKSLRAEMAKLEAERDRHMQRATTVEESGGGRAVRDKIAALRAEAQREEKMGLGDMAKRTRSTADKLEKRNDAGVASEAAEHRAAAAAIDKDIGGKRKEIAAAEKQEQKAARDEKAKHLREQRAEDRAAAADERAVKREMHQEETQRQRFGRIGMNLGMQAVQGGSLSGGIGSLAGMAGPGMMAGVAAIGAVAVGKLVEEISKDVHERRGIELRDQAARRMSKYEFGVMAGVRGTSGQAQSKEDDLTQQSEERAANRAELEHKGERRWYNPLRWFGNKQTWESQRELTEDDKKQNRTQEEIETARALKREKFANEEGGLGLDALRQRSKRTQSGAREAFMDDYLAKALGVKRQMRGQGASEAEQNEAAQLDMTNSLRDRQVKAGASLVDARSGAGDIAAAARWGGQSTPNEGEMVKRLDRIVTKMDETDRANRLKDHSVK